MTASVEGQLEALINKLYHEDEEYYEKNLTLESIFSLAYAELDYPVPEANSEWDETKYKYYYTHFCKILKLFREKEFIIQKRKTIVRPGK